MFDLNFPHAGSVSGLTAIFRAEPADFVVEEVVEFAPSGVGEHLYLHIEKVGQNTLWVAKELAAHFGGTLTDVGYCGLKDRQAIARQWFSVRLPRGKEANLEQWHLSGVRLLSFGRHDRKLRPGEHVGNRFVIRLRQVEGEHEQLNQCFAQVSLQGVPNYFGEQRFGRGGSNLLQAQSMVDAHPSVWRQRKHQFALASIRAWLFNQVLAERVRQGTWCVCVDGDPDSLPTGPLWGRGRLTSSAALNELECQVTAAFPQWRNVLEHTGVSQQRRPLCLLLAEAEQWWEGSDCLVSFLLPPGTFATSVIRELVSVRPAVTP